MAATYVGTFGGAEAGDFGFTNTWTTTTTINAGEHVVVICSQLADVSSVSVGALSLSQDLNINQLDVWSAPAVSQISSGATVTITFATETGSYAAVGEILDGIASSSYIVDTASNTGTGTSASTGTTDGTPVAGDLAVGATCSNASTGDISSVAGDYQLMSDDGSAPWGFGTGIGAVQGAYDVLASGGATSATFTISESVDWVAGIVVYLADAGGTNATVDADTDDAVGTATASIVAPPKPRPEHPFSEVNLRM